MNAIKSALRKILLVIISIVLISLIWGSWTIIKTKYDEYVHAGFSIPKLQDGERNVIDRKEFLVQEYSKLLERFGQASASELEQQIQIIDEKISKLDRFQLSAFERSKALMKGNWEVLQIDMELAVLQSAKEHLQKLHSNALKVQHREAETEKLARLRREYQEANEALVQKEKELEIFNEENYREIPGTGYGKTIVFIGTKEWKRQKELKKEYGDLLATKDRVADDLKSQEEAISNIIIEKIAQFKLPEAVSEKVLHPLKQQIDEFGTKRNSLFEHIPSPYLAAIPVAIGIVVISLLTPIFIKTFMFFVMAPWVSRRKPICLMPSTSGAIDCEGIGQINEHNRTSISAVSKEISVDANHEMLIHPEYLQGSSLHGRMDTKFLFNWSFPWASLLAGLVAMTRIRATEPETFVLSSTKDPLSEIGVIDIPEGSAIIFHPHNLVGIVQSVDNPVVITRRWQLHKLNAWLTLQLRYFVFHGPVKLIVKGCRGVRVERSGGGRSVNQAATMGFSANLEYSVARCEPFVSYLRGKQELFNNKFSGADGYYIYEEMPHHGTKSSLLFGRGLEGFLDVLLKIGGI